MSLKDYKRVLKIARKPTWKEFKQSAIVVGLGMIAIGIMGMLFTLLFGWIGI
ncbi:MAG: protein translocase SEC61 complex subunit gamma [Candidatus Altiarchaeota archaeon]|nr:protein translocase SEC61 complex subunit gamma [Candidatus Altiarchaeota archaeon]